MQHVLVTMPYSSAVECANCLTAVQHSPQLSIIHQAVQETHLHYVQFLAKFAD